MNKIMEFKKKYGKTSLESIINFETRNKLILPKDYRIFLEDENGGIPYKKVFLIDKKQGEDSIDIFFGLDIEKPFLNLGYLIDVYSERFLSGILPIGEDPFGNYICICLIGENYGKIYFYDHEVENENEDGTLNWDNLYLIANSFTEFLELLH
jgi:SMI1-KNR4 cell-wall